MGKRKSKRGRTARNAQKSFLSEEPEELVKAPHSFVIHRGHLGKNANELMMNFRKLMEPYTATQLKVQKHNVLKDFMHIAGPLNVTHLIVFTKSEIALYMRVVRLPRGPTLTFRIHEYCLARDVVSSLKRAVVYEKLYSHHPLLVLNNFTGEGLHFKLMSSMFQGMLPSININKANLNSIRRCLLMNYNSDKTIDLRQYAIKVVPCGMSKAVKKLIQSKIPDLGNYDDVSEFITRSGNFSESEVEVDGPLNQVVLPQPISSRGNITSQKSSIRLYEIGPRMKLQLIKIEDGVISGDVLFHEYIVKTPEEVAAVKAQRKKRMQLKAQRRAVQEQNVRRKQQLIAEQKEISRSSVSFKDSLNHQNYNVQLEEIDHFPSHGKKRPFVNDGHRPSKKMQLTSDHASELPSSKKPVTLQDALARRKKRMLAKLKKRVKRKSVAVRSRKKNK